MLSWNNKANESALENNTNSKALNAWSTNIQVNNENSSDNKSITNTGGWNNNTSEKTKSEFKTDNCGSTEAKRPCTNHWE